MRTLAIPGQGVRARAGGSLRASRTYRPALGISLGNQNELVCPFFYGAHDTFWSSLMEGPFLSGGVSSEPSKSGIEAQERLAADDKAKRQRGAITGSEVSEVQGASYLAKREGTLRVAGSLARSRGGTLGAPGVRRGASQWLSYAFAHNGESHRAMIYVPSNYDGRPLPMIVMLHGAQQDPDDFAAGTRMNAVAEKAGFIVAYPEQSESANLLRCWNWFKRSNQVRDTGETGALAALTGALIAQYNADADRVYVAGMSAGGAMAINLAISYPDIYAAAAIHSGLAFGVADESLSALCAMNDGRGKIRLPQRTSDATQSRAVPLIVFHGDADDTVHPRNSEQIVDMITSLRGGSSDAPVQISTRLEGDGHRYACTRNVWQDRNGALLVEQWLVHGLGHAWSGGHFSGTYTDERGPDASAEIVRFVSQFSLVDELEH